MGGYDHISSKYDLFFYDWGCRNMKNEALPNSHFCMKISKSAEFTHNEHGKPTLHFLTASHVLEMFVKVKLQCLCFEIKALFCSGGFEFVSYLFLFKPGLLTRCNLYHTILFLL